ncbi:MAG: hypothetical protein JST09_19460, partial [Bacteroidetes bacterium]|nr:hypothetical protein [Bacteroidota bacterium]
MKKYFSFLLIIVLFTATQTGIKAQSVKDKVIATITSFPYQHKQEADAALTAMGTWNKSQWISFLKLLDD